MRIVSALLLFVVLQATATQPQQVDLEALLRDSTALQKVKIMYEPPSRDSYRALFVLGSGSIVWQAYPNRPMALTEVPTCRVRLGADDVRDLIRLMIQRHFVDLPEKRFLFLSIAQDDKKLEIHTIAIDDGLTQTIRSFAVGEYDGKQESIPPDFAAIEKQLIDVKDSAFPSPGKPCHLGKALRF